MPIKPNSTGGYAPLGYKLVDKHYVIDEQELSYPIQQLLLFKHKKTD